MAVVSYMYISKKVDKEDFSECNSPNESFKSHKHLKNLQKKLMKEQEVKNKNTDNFIFNSN